MAVPRVEAHSRKWAGIAMWVFFLRSVHCLGVNWGTQMSHMMPSNLVVKILQEIGITKVKLFDANPIVLGALAGSKIEVMVGIPNDMLQLLATSTKAADAWVHQNISGYLSKDGVNIKYVAVGNEPFLTSYNGTFEGVTYPALVNVEQSLTKANLANKVKVTVPLNADILSNPNAPLPSYGIFRPDISGTMLSIVSLLNKIGAPFTINIYPFISLHQDPDFPHEFAFFDGLGSPVIDGTNTYTNVFDASYDLLVAALNNAGYSNMPIIVGEVGWPTDGDINANVQNAHRFNQGLLKHMLTSRGTPLRPGVAVEAYLFSLIDEDEKSTEPGGFERHWGIYTFDGQAKYPIDLTGRGLGNTLVNAHKLAYLPSRWCVLNPKGDQTKLGSNVGYACTYADCTSLSYGGTCNFLSSEGNASYAFNSYYQMNDQLPESCNFEGLAMITNKDPSVGGCRFEVQIFSGALHKQHSSWAMGYTGLLITLLCFFWCSSFL